MHQSQLELLYSAIQCIYHATGVNARTISKRISQTYPDIDESRLNCLLTRFMLEAELIRVDEATGKWRRACRVKWKQVENAFNCYTNYGRWRFGKPQ